MWLLNPYRFGAAVAPLLDLYPSAAAAYSLRLLRTAYSGPVIRVRRSSDSNEQDFTAAQVTDGTLTAFCGAGNGFVRTWYDQSGNGLHGEQATTANQPQIVSSGIIILSGSLRVLRFNGTTQFLSLPAGALNWERTQAFTCFCVANIANQNSYIVAKQQGSGNSTGWGVFQIASTTTPPGFGVQVRNSGSSQAWRYTTGRYSVNTVFEAVYKGDSSATNIELAYNGTNQSGVNQGDNLNASILNSVTATIGSRENGLVPLNGDIAELVLYPVAQSALNRAGVNLNINSQYAIYTYDTDAAAYIAAVEAADGQTLETGVKDAYNAFFAGCKVDGTFAAIKASCIMVGARTLAGALVPLVGTAPTRFGTEAGWNYNRKTGLQGNGTDNYLNSNRNSNADPQNNLHLAVRLTSVGSASKVVVGALSSTSPLITSQISIISTSRVAAFASSGTGSSEVIPSVPTLVGIARSTSSQHLFRVNGVTYTESSTSAATGAFPHYVFARNNSNSSVVGISNARLAFYSIGESLNLALLDARVTRLVQEIEFSINTGLSGTGYDIDVLRYVNAGYAAGGTLA